MERINWEVSKSLGQGWRTVYLGCHVLWMAFSPGCYIISDIGVSVYGCVCVVGGGREDPRKEGCMIFAKRKQNKELDC